jgi:hypothetical protein
MKILVSIFLLISSAAFGQVYQRQTAPFEFTRGIKQDTIAVIPRGCDTVALPRMKFGAPTIGALYYDTCANTLYVKDSWGWVPVTGGLDSAAFAPVIDSTGQRFYRVLFAVNNKIYGSDKFTYDSLLNYLLVTGKVEADSLIINGGAEFIGSTYIDDLEAYNLRVTNTAAVYDTTNYKIGVINTSTGRVERFAYWPANGGTSGSYVDTIYRKPGTDSIFYTINGGAERAIKDSIGGGGSGDYVPYEGATRKVRLTDYGLLTDFVDFDLTPVNADTTGRLNWDSTAGTLAVHLKGNNVHLQIGQEQVILVRNNTGSPLTDGQIVYITGSTGEVPTVALANNKTFTIASRTLGMVTEPIAHGQQGYITITGIVNGLNTNALTEGAAIWLDSLNGGYTQSQPASPYNDVLLGYVVKKSGGNGSIFVKAQNILDRNYTDSVVGLRLRIADTVGMRAKEVLSFAKNAARDSAILTLFDGTRLAVRDSVGGGGSGSIEYVVSGLGIRVDSSGRAYTVNSDTASAVFLSRQRAANTYEPADSVAVINRTAVDQTQNIVSSNSFSGGGAQGTVNEREHNIFLGYRAGQGATATATANSNIVLGGDAFRLDSTGTENVAIGLRAMEDAQGAVRNTAIGTEALSNITSGTFNFALGWRAGLGITTGTSNVAIGQSALLTITTGINNVAVGTAALDALPTTAGRNVGIGTNALGSANSSDASGYNTAIGDQAGLTITSGVQNTAIGGIAMAVGSITTGTNNTMVGYSAGRDAATTGSSNTALGAFALNSGNTAAQNQTTSIGTSSGNNSGESQSTYVGHQAGTNANAANSTGSYNNAFGFQTMYYNSATARTGVRNTVIGDRIDLPSVTSNDQFVWGTNGVNYLTRFTGGGWLINYTASAVTTQTASAALEVNGTTGAVLFPRMTTEQRNALTPTNGMVIYNTSTDKLQVRAAAAWVDLH